MNPQMASADYPVTKNLTMSLQSDDPLSLHAFHKKLQNNEIYGGGNSFTTNQQTSSYERFEPMSGNDNLE